MDADLAARLRRLEDRSELRELTIRYCLAIDDADWAGLARLFTADATLGATAGRETVIGLLRSIRSTYGRTIHTATGQVLSFADDQHATGIVPSRAELDIGGQTVHCAMRYLDSYRREDGAWLFSGRQIRFVYAQPWAGMATSLTADLPVHWPGTGASPADELALTQGG
jgi:hypothetical protein